MTGKIVEMREGNVEVVITIFQSAIRMATELFQMDPIAVAGCLGRVAGKFVTCEDDIMKHDPRLMAEFRAAAAKHGVTIMQMPCIDTFELNFKDACEKHQELHDRIRKDLAGADDMLAKVFEAHKGKGK